MSLTVEKCLQAWTTSLKQMNAKANIVFFGDSLIYYGDFASVFPDKVVCNLGLRGDTLQGMKNRVEQVMLLEPEKVYMMAGINDVAVITVDEFKKQYDSLVMALKKQCPFTKLTVFNMLPVNVEDFSISCNNEQILRANEEIASLCIKQNVDCIDLYNVYVQSGKLPKEMSMDGIHLKPSSYSLWKQSLSY